jgi:hypothetical protein
MTWVGTCQPVADSQQPPYQQTLLILALAALIGALLFCPARAKPRI